MARIITHGDPERRTAVGPWQCTCHGCMSVVELLVSDRRSVGPTEMFYKPHSWYVCPACGSAIAASWVEDHNNLVPVVVAPAPAQSAQSVRQDVIDRLQLVADNYPELRIGQIMINMADGKSDKELFYMSDAALRDRLDSVVALRKT